MTDKYIPLYRKYRPQTFYDLIGQENIVKALSNAIELNKIAHAYLLCGPRGTGKTSSARILAKSLNCKEGPTLKPCGVCPSCLDIMNSVPVDVIEIDAASNRSVEDTQAILEKIQYVPVNGRYKIYVIDEVHMLSNHAFNALLKTLEEPPENVIFILATTEPHKVLETIISRCQRFDFRRITTDDIVKRLEYIAKQENINIVKEALISIAKNSAGGMRDAVALLDQISVLGHNKQIDVNDINELLGKISYDILFEIANCVLNSDSQNSVHLIDKIYNKGNEPSQIINNLIQYFRDLMILKNCKDKALVLNLTQLNENYLEKILPQAEKFEISVIVNLIDKLAYYAAQIKDTTNKYLWLELCIIDISNSSSLLKLSNIEKRLENLEDKIESGNIQATAPKAMAIPPIQKVEPAKLEAPKKQPEPAPIKQETVTKPIENVEIKTQQETSTITESSSDLSGIWASMLQNIESMPSKMFYMSLAKPIELTQEKIVISFAKEIFVKQAKEDTKKLPLKHAALKYFGVSDINIQVFLNDEAPKNEPKVETAKKKPAVNDIKKESTPVVEESPEDDGYDELLKSKQPEQVDYSHSDQAKMVLELFNGKQID